jgi:hypoxanthine phosphoribosyltransferase
MAVDSAYTSTRQIPATFKKFKEAFTEVINLDYGGGRFNDATNYLDSLKSVNMVYDPFNRSQTHNDKVIDDVIDHGVHTITCLNVLNVVQDKNERTAILSHIRSLSRDSLSANGGYPDIYVQIYEGNRTGIPSTTTAQVNKKTTEYYDEIREIFEEGYWEVKRHGNIYRILYIY